jgi:RNA recognition motif-containing protein
MNSRLYVGNLSYDVSSDSLRDFFGSYGHVNDVYVVRDRRSGRPRGCAFITMGSETQARGAICDLDNAMFEGRALRVTIAERERRGAQDTAPRGVRKAS